MPRPRVSPCSEAATVGHRLWQAQAIAELGFVVVMIDGLGMPYRSREFRDVSYRNLADAGLPDHISALRLLAERYRYLDLERVGIFGHSAGGYASARAILAYPDFYKVCVSSACPAGYLPVVLAGRRGRAIVLALIIVARTPMKSFAGNQNQRKDESGDRPGPG